jgi:hypothetical protein
MLKRPGSKQIFPTSIISGSSLQVKAPLESEFHDSLQRIEGYGRKREKTRSQTQVCRPALRMRLDMHFSSEKLSRRDDKAQGAGRAGWPISVSFKCTCGIFAPRRWKIAYSDKTSFSSICLYKKHS